MVSAASPPPLDLEQVIVHARFKVRIGSRETTKELEWGTCGLELGFDRVE